MERHWVAIHALVTGGGDHRVARVASAAFAASLLLTTVLASDAKAQATPECQAAFATGPQPPIDTSAMGVSINSGDVYTNTPQVTLDVSPRPGPIADVWEQCAVSVNAYPSEIAVSNDGGFVGASRFSIPDPLALVVFYPWTLVSSGPERLPKTVYVRLLDGWDAGRQFTDDIILDQKAPVVQSAQVVGGGAASSAARATAAARKLKLRIKARDRNSGLGEMQVTAKKKKPGKWRKFKKRVRAKAKKGKAFVRVRDRAGNESRWKRAKARG